MMSTAITGKNGDNETNIQWSRSIEFAIYNGDNGNEIQVHNLTSKPIDLWISKDPNVPIDPFEYINVLNDTLTSSNSSNKYILESGFLLIGFKLSNPKSNVSIHVQIKPPMNKSSSYLTLLKYGDNPLFATNYYDSINIFCPQDLIKTNQNGDDSYYLIFENMSRVSSFNKSYIGISLIELNSSQLNSCQNKAKYLMDLNSSSSSILTRNGFTNNFWMRIFTAGCYYMNTQTNMWSSYGMEILSDTNLTHTHCQSNHLTTFAGGFVVLPPSIDFNYVWANASFLQNPVIYSTVLALICLYILMGIWSRWMDMKDDQKQGFTVIFTENCEFCLDENKIGPKYYAYEMIVYTGSRPNAGTKSNVLLDLLFSILFLIKIHYQNIKGKFCYLK
jgi:hypothetical protein